MRIEYELHSYFNLSIRRWFRLGVWSSFGPEGGLAMLDTIYYAITASALFLGIERLVGPLRGMPVSELKESAVSISMGVGRFLLGLVAAGLVLLSLIFAREL